MKRITAFFLTTAVLITLLSGCSGNGTSSTTSSTSSTGGSAFSTTSGTENTDGTSGSDSSATTLSSDNNGSTTSTTTSKTTVSSSPSLVLHAAPSNLPAALKNTDYTFSVKGGGKDWQKIAAYNVKIDPELPANTRVVDGNHNTIEPKVQNSPLISFDLSGSAEISIVKNRGTFQADKVKIYPESRGIRPTVSGNTITFSISGPQQLAVSLDGTKTNMAYIMVNAPSAKPQAQKTFPSGVTTLPQVGNNVWNGTIRNVYLYKMALPDALITQLKDTDVVPLEDKPVLLKKYEETFTFDGKDDFYDVPDGGYYYNTSGQFSISAKVTLKEGSDATPQVRAILMESLYRLSDGTLASNIGGWEEPYITNEKLPADGKEHHVVLVKDGQKVTIYIDGKACTAQNNSDKRPSDTQSVQFWTVIGAGEIINGYYLQDNETVYLEPGAIVRGTLIASGVKNVRITGRGMIDVGTITDDVVKGGFNYNTQRGILVFGSDGVTIDGITINNAYSFSVYLRESRNVTVSNIKIFSHYGATDGINMKACNKVAILDSFIRSNDDCISIYASNDSAIGSTSDITAENCILTSDAAHAVFTGIHAAPLKKETISNLTFKDLEIIDSRTIGDPYYGVLGINAGNNVSIKQVLFENIRVSSVKDQQLFNVRVMLNSAYNSDPGLLVDGVTFRNITYTGSTPVKSSLSGYDSSRMVKNITFDNVVINGSKVTGDNASTYLAIGSYTSGIQYK